MLSQKPFVTELAKRSCPLAAVVTNDVSGNFWPVEVLTGHLEKGCVHTVPCVVEPLLSQKKTTPYIGENP